MQDYLDKEGAMRLAESIRWYWFKRGFEIVTQIIPTGIKGIYAIRSNLMLGLPPS